MFQKPQSPQNYRAIFVSDIHLGTKRAQAEAFLDFLAKTESDYLYLVGDIIDSWSLRQHWHWQQSHNDVIQKLLRKARKGTKLFYIPGNHDENFRDFANLRFGKVVVADEAIHLTANGSAIWFCTATSLMVSCVLRHGWQNWAIKPTKYRCR